jgi:DNA-binding MarR family transcriptional regulator
VSPTRTPSDEELALAESMFAMFSLFKHVMIDAAQTCDVASPERAKIMSSLKAAPVRSGQLAHIARLSPSAITETVEGLESDGLVRRESDPSDRRVVRVALTAEGRRQVQRFETACVASLTERLAPLTSVQRQRIRAAMNELREVLRNDFMESSRPDASVRSPKANKEVANVR